MSLFISRKPGERFSVEDAAGQKWLSVLVERVRGEKVVLSIETAAPLRVRRLPFGPAGKRGEPIGSQKSEVRT
jgi:hypothetical protein